LSLTKAIFQAEASKMSRWQDFAKTAVSVMPNPPPFSQTFAAVKLWQLPSPLLRSTTDWPIISILYLTAILLLLMHSDCAIKQPRKQAGRRSKSLYQTRC
jgi:hypothetical protein